MHTTGNIIGRHVRLTSGEALGPVTDLIIDHCARKVIALRVQVNGAVHEIPYATIIDAREGTLTVAGRGELVPLHRTPRPTGCVAYAGAPVCGGDGAPLGTASGLRIDPATGSIRSYEVTPTGTRNSVLIPAPQLSQVESGTLVVTPGTAALLGTMHEGERQTEPKGELTAWA